MSSLTMASNASFTSVLTDNVKEVTVNLPPQLDRVFDAFTSTNRWTIILGLFVLMVAYDQTSYFVQKGSIEGPSWKLPFMGPFIQSINPKFSKYLAAWASGPVSCVSIFHKFVVIVSNRDLSRKIFNSPAFVKPCVVDAGHKILGATNWVFLDGRAHVDFRKGLNGLFTRQALDRYMPGLEDVYNRYFERFVEITNANAGKPVPFMPDLREVMCAVSCRTFVGYYISDEAIKKISDDYYLITSAIELVNFPIIIPFTKTWYGKKTSEMVQAEFARCAAKSKARMAAGGEVTCVMDGWVKLITDSARYREAQEKGEPMEKPSVYLRDFSDFEIAQTIFTFLFASQDASSSAATWLFQIMAQRPEVLDRVREENRALRNGDVNAPITMEQLDTLKYTRAVVRELLRWRPPVIMVPYVTKKPFPITPDYTVPKGAMILPTVYSALRDPEVYPNPDYFDPERYYSGDAEEKGAKNYLVFGTGPHYCLGQIYAQANLALLIGKASLMLDWKHHPTPGSEEIKVFCTLFPMDDCPLTFSKRQEA